MILLLIALVLGIIALEAPALLRQKMYAELTAFGVLLTLGITLNAAEIFDITLFNPTKITEAVFSPVTHIIEKALGV